MENRFGIKDFFLYVLICVLIIVVLVAMKQYDRQYKVLQSIQDNTSRQTKELADISRTLTRLHISGPATAPSASQNLVPRVFQRIAAAREKEDYAMGDWFIDAIGNTENLTPLTSTDAYASDVQGKVLESLATRDPVTLEWIPLLSESWEIIENSKEYEPWFKAQQEAGKTSDDMLKIADAPHAMAIRFKIRPGVVFSDGAPFTADDVVFTYDWIMNEKVDAPRERSYYKLVKSVTKLNEMEVEFKYRQPYFKAFDFAGGMPILHRQFYSKYAPEQFNSHPGLLIGTGQYRMEDPSGWSPGKPIQLLRNERYWGVPAGFDRIVYKNVDSDLARITALKNGEIDGLFALQTDVYQELMKDDALVKSTQQFEYDSPVSGYRYIGWNQRRNGSPTRFADKRVRQAMTMLTNRTRMVEELLAGLGTIITGPFHPASPQHDPNIKPWPYDVDRAKRLLTDAGFVDRNGDQVIEDPSGQPFQFKLTYPAGIGNYQQMALDLKDSYARAGIKLDLEPLDWSVFSQRLKTRDFDAITLAWGASIEGDIYQMFHSSQIEGGGDNAMSFASPELDKIIELARKALVEEERMKLWHQAEAILHEEQPYTFLFTRKELSFVNDRIRNVQKLPLGLNSVEEWYVPSSEWKWMK